MDWQATDQFGNLYIGESSATSIDDLVPDLKSLVSELIERNGTKFQLTIDFEYQEVNGPHPENVTHIMRIPWLSTMEKEAACTSLADALKTICATKSLTEVEVCLAN